MILLQYITKQQLLAYSGSEIRLKSGKSPYSFMGLIWQSPPTTLAITSCLTIPNDGYQLAPLYLGGTRVSLCLTWLEERVFLTSLCRWMSGILWRSVVLEFEAVNILWRKCRVGRLSLRVGECVYITYSRGRPPAAQRRRPRRGVRLHARRHPLTSPWWALETP
jgi:hypothetical protein